MLSYRHSYHAGNHADVLKHIVLTLCINSLKEKEKPFLYLDTHSGAGRYLLQSEHAEKTGEFLSGINLIWQQSDTPELLNTYLSVLKRYNPSKLPPESRRGIILIDPSYEIKDDYQKIPKALLEAYKRFATGIYLIWYPVVSRTQTQKMIDEIVNLGIKKISQFEFAIKPDNNQKGMTASGMIVINPPWKLQQQMQTIMPWLKNTLDTEKMGNYLIKELVPE